MSTGGWPTEGRHGRHRRGHVNSAWTPAVRPSEAGRIPSHARFGWVPPSPADDADDTAVVHAVPETPPRGLRKFDLGIVPASVTPPRSWRKAAWFAVGTSAAVVCGLVVAAVRLVGTPPGDTIDALPAFPTQSLGALPVDETATAEATSTRRPTPPSSSPDSRPETISAQPVAPRTGSPEPGTITSADAPTGPTTEPSPPPRTTVGPRPLTPTDPQAMGDRTELYFALVTEDPRAAHDMCTGSMAREGPAGIRSRYEGVDHVEVQDITIDRNLATTTSTVKIVRKDGSATVEERQLTFTWGGNPKISDDTRPPARIRQ